MRSIMKLTPATIKKMIAEEREKLNREEDLILQEQEEALLLKLRLLKKIKNRQIKSLQEAKDLNEATKILVKRIKGKK